MMVRRCVSPLTAVGTEGYSRVTIKGYSPARIKGGPAIQTIGMPGGWSLLLAGVVLALAAITGAAWLHEVRTPSMAQTAAQAATQTINVRAIITQPPALTGDEERFATDLWVVHREATRSAVAMSFAGIAYHTEERDQRALARKIEPLAKFFHDAETQVRAISAPMLKFVENADARHLEEAHRMDVRASQDMLRVGEVLWPAQYKPH